MNERQQLGRVCPWNRSLSRANTRLKEQLHGTERKCQRLTESNAALGVELRAGDELLSVAMDQCLTGRERP